MGAPGGPYRYKVGSNSGYLQSIPYVLPLPIIKPFVAVSSLDIFDSWDYISHLSLQMIQKSLLLNRRLYSLDFLITSQPASFHLELMSLHSMFFWRFYLLSSQPVSQSFRWPFCFPVIISSLSLAGATVSSVVYDKFLRWPFCFLVTFR